MGGKTHVYNPLLIPMGQWNEREGTCSFNVSESNLFDEAIGTVRILEIAKNQTVFILERDSSFNLRFIQSSPNYDTRIAGVNIRDFSGAPKLHVAFTWSEKENAIYVGDFRSSGLKSERSSSDPNIKFRVGKDGAIYQLGDKGIQVGFYAVRVGTETVLEPTAYEGFQFQMEKIQVLLRNCKTGDFLFESIVVQQMIVMLTTAFEVYSRTRFIELEKEAKTANIDALCNRFVPGKYRQPFRVEVRERAKEEKRTELEVFLDKRAISFQDWESFKDAYSKGYGLRIGEIGIPNQALVDIQKFILWRQRIIHSRGDQTMINSHEVPPAQPIFTNKELAEKGLCVFRTVVDRFHEYTLKL
jgi:hypothetical protein